MKSFSIVAILIAVVSVVAVLALIIFVAKKLIGASKDATNEEDGGTLSLESQIRGALSKARQQKFKADTQVRRLEAWANDAITTTYSDLFPNGMPYPKNELLANYQTLKAENSDKLSYEQAQKCDQIVTGYANQIEAEKAKIQTFDKIQTEYEALREKVRLARQKERKQEKLDKHIDRIKSAQDDISADATAIEQEYRLDDLAKEVAMKEEYINQLEKLSFEYGEEIPAGKSLDYKNSVNNILDKM